MLKYDDFLELVKYRRSIRNFKTDAIPDEYITRILDVAHYAMSGANSQPWEFIVIKDPEIKKALFKAYLSSVEHVWHLEQMRMPEYRHPNQAMSLEEKIKSLTRAGNWGEAPVVIAVLQDPRKQFGSVMAAFEPPSGVLSESMAHCTWTIHLAAASLGLGSHRIDIQVQQPFREILGYPEPIHLNILVPVGYRSYEPGPPNRFPLEELVHFEKYDMSKYLRNEDFLKHIKRIRTFRRLDIR
jgi:5,6-dimethylbenzimidazole synthase